MISRRGLRAWEESTNSVRLPIAVSESERGEIDLRLNNRLQVILSAAQLILSDTQEEETRPVAEAIHTEAQGMLEDMEELFGPALSGTEKKS